MRIREAFEAGDMEALRKDLGLEFPHSEIPFPFHPCLEYAIYHSPLTFIRTLLELGADPNQRGINDYTPLHMAVAERNEPAVAILLSAGADPALRTRIDECETAGDMARAAGLEALAAVLS